MEKDIFRIFVYGSLRSGFLHPAYEYISQYFKLVSEAKVKGYLYDMGNYPVGSPTEEEAFIRGELYEINKPTEFSWAIQQLDDYEGVRPEPGELTDYRRDIATVYYNDITTPAWIYWYGGNVEGLPVIASGDVLQFFAQKSKL